MHPIPPVLSSRNFTRFHPISRSTRRIISASRASVEQGVEHAASASGCTCECGVSLPLPTANSVSPYREHPGRVDPLLEQQRHQPLRLASEMDDCRTPRKVASSVCVRHAAASKTRCKRAAASGELKSHHCSRLEPIL